MAPILSKAWPVQSKDVDAQVTGYLAGAPVWINPPSMRKASSGVSGDWHLLQSCRHHFLLLIEYAPRAAGTRMKGAKQGL